jgi:DNA-binding response OmpR family regulator
VQEAVDGVEAVETTTRLRPAALVLDRILPRLGAEQVAERLLAHGATAVVPIFVLADPEDLGAKAGLFRACLPRPLDRGQLEAALEALGAAVS